MADIASLQNQLRQWRDYYSTIPGGEQELYRKVSEYAQQQGLSPDVVAQVVQGVAPNPSAWDGGRVQNIMDQQLPAQYGLSGATSALREGAQRGEQAVTAGTNAAINTLGGAQSQALGMLGGTQQQVTNLFNQGQQQLTPWIQPGVKANDLQAALSGSLGPEAQKQAYANYQESPGVAYAREQGEQAIRRNAAATGQLGGGNTLNELNRHAVGTYMQDFNNQFNRIGTVADRGFNAASTSAGLRGQEAGVQSSLGQFGANIPVQIGSDMANIQSAAGNTLGTLRYGSGNLLGQFRSQAGTDLANQVSGVSSALAKLIESQGTGMAEITGNYANNLSTLYQNAANGDAAAMQELGTLLGNINMGASGQVSGTPNTPTQPSNYLGQIGQVASGVGGLLSGINGSGQQPVTLGQKTPVGSSVNPALYATQPQPTYATLGKL